MIKSALSGESLNDPIYSSESSQSVTSLSQIYKGVTKVYYDPKIGHLQTNEIADINKYYDEEYQIYDDSEEDDILYKVIDGKKIFRQQHQVDIFLSKVEMTKGMRILDYGCAKGTVLKRLHRQKPDVIPYLFDVSKMYVHLWEQFVSPEQYSSYEIRKEWKHTFDVVTSFFAFEHTPDPLRELSAIKELMKPGGMVYMIVPNVYENTGDFIVADHVHHYSPVSLKYMFTKAGFEILDIDSSSHFAAHIVLARNSYTGTAYQADPAELSTIENKALQMAEYWKGLQKKIRAFSEKVGSKRSAIYGAGVYGNFIAASFGDLDRIGCFIDQNPLLQGKVIMGKPVIRPEDVPDDIELIYVGLNPITARSSIESMNWTKNKPSFFYL